jgi:hypothetical protein
MSSEGLLVTPRLLYAAWGHYLGEYAKLSLRDISNVLEEIGVSASKAMLRIRLEDLAQWCEMVHHGFSLEDLQNRVAGGR